MTTETTAKPIYLRAGATASDRSSAELELLGIQSRLFINADHTAEVYKVLKGNKLGAKPIAKGVFAKHPKAGVKKNPDIRGVVTTSKGSKISFVGWKHADEFDEYYVLSVDGFARTGTLVQF
jgi:hypothetical protein